MGVSYYARVYDLPVLKETLDNGYKHEGKIKPSELLDKVIPKVGVVAKDCLVVLQVDGSPWDAVEPMFDRYYCQTWRDNPFATNKDPEDYSDSDWPDFIAEIDTYDLTNCWEPDQLAEEIGIELHDRELYISDLPLIKARIDSADPQSGAVTGSLLHHDGNVLWSHTSADIQWLLKDLTQNFKDRVDELARIYPNGFNVVGVDKDGKTLQQ